MKSARFSLGVMAALLTLTTGQASTFKTLTLTQQAKKAQVIVRATVGSPTATQTGSGPTAVSWINYPLTVTEIIAGDVASLPTREGKPTLMFLAGLQDVPALDSGQDVFLLLYIGTQDSPLVGFNQGVYPVINGRVTRWNEAAIEAETPPTPVTAPVAASTATASTTTSASASATATAATAPPVDGATAAANNPVTPSPTPTTGPATPPATAGTGTTTTPPAGTTTTTANPATASSTAAAVTPSVTATPSQTAPPAANVPPAATPNAFERDPAKFRDQLRAARNSP